MMEKLQKNIRVRMNSSKMLKMKLNKELKNLENFEELKIWFEFYGLFEKIAFEEVISSSKYFLFFEANFKCGRIVN